MKETHILQGLAIWASYLINGDASGLSDDELGQLQHWCRFHGIRQEACVSAGEETYFGYPSGITGGGECLEYTFFS